MAVSYLEKHLFLFLYCNNDRQYFEKRGAVGYFQGEFWYPDDKAPLRLLLRYAKYCNPMIDNHNQETATGALINYAR